MRAGLAVAVLIASAVSASADPQQCTPVTGRSIIVGGSSTLRVPADRVSFTVGVSTLAAAANEAFSSNGAKARAVIAALKGKGVTDKEIQTSNLEIEPQKAEGTRPAAFRAGNLVTVTLEDPARAGELLQAAVAAGANEVSGLHFFVAEPSKSQDKGLQLAFSDARARASILAALSGKAVGDVICVSDAPTWAFGVPVSGGVVGGVETPVETGVQELHYAVYVVFELR